MAESANGSGVYSNLRTIFVCGFIDKRWHNGALMAIVADLLPTYYICTNPSAGRHWTRQRTKHMLASAEALIFFINEFTVRDDRCLLTIQYAWDLMIPTVMIRPPRTKLIFSQHHGTTDRYGRPGLLSRHRVSGGGYTTANTVIGDRPDFSLLQDILYRGYRESIPYDRLSHDTSMRIIKQRLVQVIPEFKPSIDINHKRQVSSASTTAHLKLPHITSGTISPTQSMSPFPPSPTMRISRSMVELSRMNRRDEELIESTIKMQHDRDTVDNKAMAPISDNPQQDHRTNVESVNSSSDDQHHHPSLVRTPSERRYSMTSIKDYNLYQSTQYLIFSIKDKTQKPMLIRFPEDVHEKHKNEYDNGSVWGSDTSYEEDVELATMIQGNLQLPDSRNSSPAPYMEPI